jgi:hypothetical protein
MCILQPRSLLLALAAVAVSALAPGLAAAQRMARPAAPATGSMARPLINSNSAFMGPFNGFRSPSFGMMAYPGMSAASSYGAGSRGNSSAMGSNGGGMSPYSYGAQTDPYDAGSPGYGADSRAGSEARSEGKSLSLVLTAAGVPNSGGRLQWPLGLRVVGGPAGGELRQQIDALFRYGAEQTQTGPVSPHLTRELAASVRAMRTLLLRDREERFSLAHTTYEDAERFLAQLDHARKLLEVDSEPPVENVP